MNTNPRRHFASSFSRLPLTLSLVSSLGAGIVGISGCDTKQAAPPPAITSSQVTAPAVQPTQQPSSPPPAPISPAEQSRVQQLIAQVERSFLSGNAHYRKGQL